MSKTNPVWIITAMVVATSPSLAQEVVIPKGETQELKPGGHFLDLLEIREDATLKISGGTDIFATKIVTQKGARIVYDNPERSQTGNLLVIGSRDAAGLTDLRVTVNGKDGSPAFDGGKPAAKNGGNGGGARDPKLKVNFWDSDFDGNKASYGGNGASGADGGDGEDAFDVRVFLQGVKPGSTVYVESVGGNGGAGQNGGNGGKGGAGSKVHDCRGGGDGGNGGRGGSAGDAGRVTAHLIVGRVTEKAAENAKRGFQLRTNAARGKIGQGGLGGDGGTRGDRGGNPNVCNAKDGQKGNPGAAGQEGEGPDAGNEVAMKAWQIVDVLSEDDYLAYLEAKRRMSGMDSE